ncbi:MAG: glycosyltransferase family 2 protein, partial [Pseudonocardiaceae bacterium]
MSLSSRTAESELTVVIPTLGRSILRKCLESLEVGEPRPACVIVVDQGRRPEVAALLEEFSARGLETEYVTSVETGRAAGVNRGIERARTHFIALTDDDCVVASDWVGRMAARLREHPGAIVTGRVCAGEGEVVLSVVTSEAPAIQRRPS